METTLQRFLREEAQTLETVVILSLEIKAKTALLKVAKSRLWMVMNRLSMKSVEVAGGTIRFNPDTTTEIFDKKAFKRDYPDLWARYCTGGCKDGHVAFYEKKK